ncbi:MAG TPA: nitroreductase family protein [Planctomycetota bacterium]|nr:nitroreductase family protein [Planctomycetota bacterium]
MDVLDAIRARRSVRAYRDTPVPDEVLARVLEAARLAPSARNRQEWRFIAVRDEATRRALAEAAKGQTWVAEAPVCLAFCATEDQYVMSCGQKAGTVDVSAALAYVTLAAAAEGLGTCWLGAFYEDRVKAILGAPAGARVVGMTPLGYPAENPPPRPRKPAGDVISFERW